MFAEIKENKIIGIYEVSQKEGRGKSYEEIEIEESDPRVVEFRKKSQRVGLEAQAKAMIRECNIALMDEGLSDKSKKALRACTEACKKVYAGESDEMPSFPEILA